MKRVRMEAMKTKRKVTVWVEATKGEAQSSEKVVGRKVQKKRALARRQKHRQAYWGVDSDEEEESDSSSGVSEEEGAHVSGGGK